MNIDKRNANNDGTTDILRTIARANGMMLQGDIPGAESVLDEVIVGVRQLMAERDELRTYKEMAEAHEPLIKEYELRAKPRLALMDRLWEQIQRESLTESSPVYEHYLKLMREQAVDEIAAGL